MLPCSNVPQYHSFHWTIIFNVRAASVHVINMDSWTRLGPVRVYEAGLRIYKVKCSCVVGFVLIQIIFIFLQYLIRITWGEWKELRMREGFT